MHTAAFFISCMLARTCQWTLLLKHVSGKYLDAQRTIAFTLAYMCLFVICTRNYYHLHHQLFKGALHRQCFNETAIAWTDDDISADNTYCNGVGAISTCDAGFICRADGYEVVGCVRVYSCTVNALR